MLTRVLFAIGLLVAATSNAWAAGPGIVRLGLTDHATSEEELAKPGELPQPRYDTGGVAFALVENLEPGDEVRVDLANNGRSLMNNAQTIEEATPQLLLQAGKTGVPAGGWPEGEYNATLKVVRDGKTVLDEQTEPITLR